MQFIANSKSAGFASANFAYKGLIPGVKNRAGRKEVYTMVMTDPIADMLTRIRNASQMKHSGHSTCFQPQNGSASGVERRRIY